MHQSPFRAIFFVIFMLVFAVCNSNAAEILWQGIPSKTAAKFSFNHDGQKFTVLRGQFSAPDSRVAIKISAKAQFGKASYIVNTSFPLTSENGLEQTYDLLPQFAGEYEIQLSGKGASFSLFLEHLADITPVSYGEQLGELVVAKAGASHLSVSPERLQIKHPDFKKGMEKGIATPDGDVVFRLPAGYWALKRTGNSEENAQLIPVSSGLRTVVKWAPTPEITIDSSASAAVRRIEIRDVSIDENKDLAVARFGLPAGISTFTPTIESLQAIERSLPAEIVDLKTSDTPLHLILLLDSSGSMKKDIKAAIDAAVKFVASLPANAIIEVIDFDTKAKPIKAASTVELVKAIKAIKADGATALRDTILLGLNKLKSSPRPALVVFTDGFDANHNDTAPGSKATEKEVFAKLTTARIPIFTIGFGANSDEATLARLADLSGGMFQTADEKNLDEVFARLQSTVAGEYLLSYRRPQKPGSGIRPVISICIDTSGSMNESLVKGIPGSRFEVAKSALHSLVNKFPDDALVQVVDFDDKTAILQTPTAEKARAHKAISAFAQGGGTNVIGAVKTCLEGLLAVPSNRRYMLFLTDEAIKIGDKTAQKQFDRLLARLKDEGIFSMWVGMVDAKDKTAFTDAAEKSGGVSVVAADLAAVQQTIDALLAKVAEPVDDKRIPLELIWQMPQTNDLPIPVSGAGLFELPPVKNLDTSSSSQEISDSISLRFENLTTSDNTAIDGSINNKSSDTASDSNLNTEFIEPTSSQLLREKPRMTIALNIKAQNSACSFNIKQLSLYDCLNEVNAPANRLFAVVDLEMTNILPEQNVVVYPDGGKHPAQWVNQPENKGKVIKAIPPYQIGDLRQHLYLRWNNEPAMPCSPVSWLLEDSLTSFGGNSVLVTPEVPVKGKVVFLVSANDGLSNGALDYYDKNYGHVSMTLAGTMAPADIKAATLPVSPIGKLGSAFNLKIDSVTDTVPPLAGATAGKHLVYRLIDFTVESQVQALLNLNPYERMHLVLPTDAGPLRRRVSAITAVLPGGFFSKVMFAPGSANNLRQAFLIPDALAAIASGCLCVDMKGDDSLINLNTSEHFTGKPADRVWTAEGNGLKVKINTQGRLKKLNDKNGDWLVIDTTVADIADGYATNISKLLFLGRADLKENGFALKPGQRGVKTQKNMAGNKGLNSFSDSKEADGNQIRIYADAINKNLMFAANDEAIVPDGQELRFIVAFKVPSAGEYLLAAEQMPLAEDLNKNELTNLPEWLFAINDEVIPSLPESFEKQLSARLKQLAALRKIQNSKTITTSVSDEDGNITLPAEELRPPVIAPHAQTEVDAAEIKLEIFVEAEPAGDTAAAQTNKAASALGGGVKKSRSFKLLGCSLPASAACQTPFEIVYLPTTDKDGNKLFKAAAKGIWGEAEGRDGINIKEWIPVKEKIVISHKSTRWPVFERDIRETGLNDRIHSIAAMIPDINSEQGKALAQKWSDSKSEKAPEHLSLWRWYAHSRLAQFIMAQTMQEQRLAGQLGITISREKAPRLMVLTGSAANEGGFEIRLDLLATQPEVSGENQAVKAFKIASGFFVSELEAKVLDGKGVFQFWGKNKLQIIADKGPQKKAWLKFAAERGISEKVISAVKQSKSVLLFPEQPAMINNKPFWAWLEIDPKTYETIGVLETGEHGGLSGEAIILALIPDGAGIALGFWKGVESSIWGMSAFIIRGDTLEEAVANTEKLLGGLVENFGDVTNLASVSVGDAEIDLISGNMTLAGFSADGSYSPWDGYKGFVSGFEAGVSYYLGKVKASANN